MIRDIEKLDPELKKKVEKLLQKLDEKEIQYFIVETKRSQEIQQAYFAQGRKPLEEVNALRKNAGLWAITEKENKNKITWTLLSKHLEGKAIDIAPAIDGKPNWSAPDEDWKEIADVAKELGMNPGYYWRAQKDCPHIE